MFKPFSVFSLWDFSLLIIPVLVFVMVTKSLGVIDTVYSPVIVVAWPFVLMALVNFYRGFW